MPLGNKLSKFDNYLTCAFDLCLLLEAFSYSLQLFGGALLSVVQSLEVVRISEVLMY